MRTRSLMRAAALATVALAGTARPGGAQTSSPVGPTGEHATVTPLRPRINVNPGPPLYRRCVGWYELQNRPSGTVLFPARHCWWVRG